MLHVVEHNLNHILFIGDKYSLIDYPKATIHSKEDSIFKLNITDITKEDLSRIYYKVKDIQKCSHCGSIEHSKNKCPIYKQEQINLYHKRAEYIVNNRYFKKFPNEYCSCNLEMTEDRIYKVPILVAKICYYCEFACCQKAGTDFKCGGVCDGSP
jgi:hypothetical protein